jgi:putative Holliday junction resolvase
MSSPTIVLGFDYGTRRVGVACGNSLTQSARPIKTLLRGAQPPWDEIRTLVKEYAPTQFVVGLPYNMDGTETALTPAVREFAAELAARFDCPAALVDERLSSRAAEEELREARALGHKRKRVAHDDVDMGAAKVLVEQWLRENSTKTDR